MINEQVPKAVILMNVALLWCIHSFTAFGTVEWIKPQWPLKN
jgi:hypothetical protein